MALVDQIIKLLPSGEGWPSYQDSNLYKTVNLFVPALQRAYNFATYALTDTFPTTAKDSIPDWQSSVGLPDPLCPPLTAAQQRQQMIARVENIGGQSPEYFIQFAAKIGYTITITEVACPRAGLSRAGQSASWGLPGDFIWIVNVAGATLSFFRTGLNRTGDPLSTGTDIRWLEYELQRIKPAHTFLMFT